GIGPNSTWIGALPVSCVISFSFRTATDMGMRILSAKQTPRPGARIATPTATFPITGGQRQGGKGMDYQRLTSLPAMFFEKVAQHGDAPFLWHKREGAYGPLS